MLLNTVLVNAALFGTGLSLVTPHHVIKRQVSVVKDGLSQINTDLGKVTTAIKSVTDTASFNTAIATVDTLDNSIKTANKDISSATPLKLQEAIQLLSVGQELVASAADVTDSLLAKKPVLDDLGKIPDTVAKINEVQTDVDTLADTIISKLPALAQNIGKQQIKPLIASAFEEAIASLEGNSDSAKPAPAPKKGSSTSEAASDNQKSAPAALPSLPPLESMI